MKPARAAHALSRLLLTSDTPARAALRPLEEGALGTVKFRPEDLKVKPGTFEVGFEVEFIVNEGEFGFREPVEIESDRDTVSIRHIDPDEFEDYFDVDGVNLFRWNVNHRRQQEKDGIEGADTADDLDVPEIVDLIGVSEAIEQLGAEPIYGWVDDRRRSIYTEDEREPEYDHEGEVDSQLVADSLIKSGMRPAIATGSDSNEFWRVQNDSSLDDGGIEVASPVFPLEKVFDEMERMFKFINDHGSTNRTCGFHVGISFTDPEKLEKMDALKLIVLFGEKDAARVFGREKNSYAKPHIQTDLLSSQEKIAEIIKEVETYGLAANFDIRRVVSDEKYRTVNIGKLRHGYIEFRLMGGEGYTRKLPEIKKFILRFCAAMEAATDPKAYKKEYLRQLYYIATHGQPTVKPPMRQHKTVADLARDVMQRIIPDKVVPPKLNVAKFIDWLDYGYDSRHGRKEIESNRRLIQGIIDKLTPRGDRADKIVDRLKEIGFHQITDATSALERAKARAERLEFNADFSEITDKLDTAFNEIKHAVKYGKATLSEPEPAF